MIETSSTSNLRIDPDRLWASITDTAKIGGTAKGGIDRLTLTDTDRQVRDWFVAACRDAGCDITVDALGNIFARRPGRDPGAAPIAIGQPPGHPTHRRQVRWRDRRAGRAGGAADTERGRHRDARTDRADRLDQRGRQSIAPAMLASGVFAGVFAPDYAYSRQDRDGVRFDDALDAIGYRGERHRSATNCRRSSNCISSRGRSWRPKQNHRHRARRAGHRLVRGDRNRQRQPCRHHADGQAARRACGGIAHGRCGTGSCSGPRAGRGRHGRVDGGAAE